MVGGTESYLYLYLLVGTMASKCIPLDLSKINDEKKLYNLRAYGQLIKNVTIDGAVSIIEDEEVENAVVRGNKIFCDGKQIAILEAI